MAKLIVVTTDIGTGSNKIPHIGISFSYLMGVCRSPGDLNHSCNSFCLNAIDHASTLQMRERIVACCPLLDAKTHDANSIQATLLHVLTHTWYICRKVVFVNR